MINLTDLRIDVARDQIVALGSDSGEGGAKLSKALQGCIRPDQFVMVQQEQAAGVADRDDRSIEISGLAGLVGEPMRAQSKTVEIVARHSVHGCDDVSGNALRHIKPPDSAIDILGPGSAIRAHRNARHRFHTAGNDQVDMAGGDLRRA